MDTRDIRCFIRCYEEQSIHKAARQLFITPQGLSKIIKHLEDEFQVPLFYRTHAGLEATESGRYFYYRCNELIAQLDEIQINMKRLGDRKNQLKIGYSCGALHVLPFRIIEDFRNQYENVSITWEEGVNAEIKEKVKRGEIDVGFVVGRVAEKNIIEEELFRTKLYAVIYEGHPLFDRESISIRDLEGEKLITLNEKYQCHFSLIQRCNDFGFMPEIVINTMESQLIYKFCEEKMGVGIDVNIHDCSKHSKNLRCIVIEDSIPWKLYMVCKSDRHKEPLIQAIMDHSHDIGINI
ncbi:MAG: LysR family transcriptional regulator [Lachnospiraceae bacterium]|nr:LysR family transcriptional regulator [Lachnospiraceae bacterium]